MRILIIIIMLSVGTSGFCQKSTISRKKPTVTIITSKRVVRKPSNINVGESVFNVVAENQYGTPFSHGVGVYLTADGIGVTNFQILQGASNAYIENKQGEKMPIDYIVDYDSKLNLVKFKVRVKKPTIPIKISCKRLEQGIAVFGFNMPKQYKKNNNIEVGLFLQELEMNDLGKVLQVSLPTDRYSIGSPLLLRNGVMVGILTANVSDNSNVSYALSANNIVLLKRNLKLPLAKMCKNELETEEVRNAYSYGTGGEYYRAVKLLNGIVENNPHNHLAIYYRGVFQCRGKLDMEAGLNDLEKACVMQNYNNYEYNMHYTAFLRSMIMSNNDMAKKQDTKAFDKVIYVLNKCIELEPNRSDAYAQLAYIISETHKESLQTLMEALKYSDKAVELDGTDPLQYIERAEIKRHLRDIGGAIIDCENAISLAPNYYRPYFIRGDIRFFELRSFNEGLEDINKALSLVSPIRKNEKADILALRGVAKASKALVESPSDKRQVLLDAINDIDEAYSLYPKPSFKDRKNEILIELNK